MHQKTNWWMVFAILLLLCTPLKGYAQSGRVLQLSPPDTSDFPLISINLDIEDPAGNPVPDVTADQIQITENGTRLELESFLALTPGVQIVFAVNNGPPLAIQDVSGLSRLDYVKQALKTFLEQNPENAPDDLSLISNDGLEITHLENRGEIISALDEYNPDSRQTEANFSVLARAVEIAADQVDQPGMKRVIVFFSPPPTPQETGAVNDLAALAEQNQVIIYPILISSPAFFSSEGAEALREAAARTGGILFEFSGKLSPDSEEEEEDQDTSPEPNPAENLPDFWQLLNSYRTTYYLQYKSQIVTRGEHTLEILLGEEPNQTSESSSFFLEVLPPNPILVNPPRTITRENPQPDQSGTPLEDYTPEDITLDILVEFPDNLPRNLRETTLRVDGQVVDQNQSPPFNQLNWDLQPYQSSGTHYLTVEAVDELGLSKVSVQTPIQIVIESPPPSIKSIVNQNIMALLGLAVILSLGLGFLYLIYRGQIQPRSYPGKSRFFSNSPSSVKYPSKSKSGRKNNSRDL